MSAHDDRPPRPPLPEGLVRLSDPDIAATPAAGPPDIVRPIGPRRKGQVRQLAPISQKAAVELMNVSRRSTQRAAAIKNDPDLAPAVERGHVTVADAY